MSKPKVTVGQACRDCKKCTNSGVANLGRNSGRAGSAVATMGLSEIAMRGFSKKCRTCGHQLSLHKGAGAKTVQPAVQVAHVAPQHVGPPPGWYDDPQGLGKRWWDGIQWTEHRHQLAPPGLQQGTNGTAFQPTAQIAGVVSKKDEPPPGWYDDPQGQGKRWWDGSKWTFLASEE